MDYCIWWWCWWYSVVYCWYIVCWCSQWLNWLFIIQIAFIHNRLWLYFLCANIFQISNFLNFIHILLFIFIIIIVMLVIIILLLITIPLIILHILYINWTLLVVQHHNQLPSLPNMRIQLPRLIGQHSPHL